MARLISRPREIQEGRDVGGLRQGKTESAHGQGFVSN